MSYNPAARRPHLPQEGEHPLLSWASPVCTIGVASYKDAKIRLVSVMLTSPESIIQSQYLKMEPFDHWLFFFLTWDTVPLSDSRLRVAISWQRMEPHSNKSLLSRSHSSDNLCCIWMVPFCIFCVPLVSDHAFLLEIYRVEMCLCWLGPGSRETITESNLALISLCSQTYFVISFSHGDHCQFPLLIGRFLSLLFFCAK